MNGCLLLGALAFPRRVSLPAISFAFEAVRAGTAAQCTVVILAEAVAPQTAAGDWVAAMIRRVCVFLLVSSMSCIHFWCSDNRHLSFYVWRKLLSKNVVRVGLVPVIAVIGAAMAHVGYWSVFLRDANAKKLSKPEKYVRFFAFKAFELCTFASLALTPLLEFRYFSVPLMVLLVLKPIWEPYSSTSLWMEALHAAAMLVGNVILFALFARWKWVDKSWGSGGSAEEAGAESFWGEDTEGWQRLML